jgi:hypothetical protein
MHWRAISSAASNGCDAISRRRLEHRFRHLVHEKRHAVAARNDLPHRLGRKQIGAEMIANPLVRLLERRLFAAGVTSFRSA